MNPIVEAITTFVTEAVRLLGWGRILTAVGLLILGALLAGWLGARLLAREGKPFMSALCASLFLMLTAVFVGAVYGTGVLQNLLDSGKGDQSALTLACAVIGIGLTVFGVHGAFGTSLWKSAILLVLVIVGSAGVGFAVMPHLFPGEPAQLGLLAHQVTGQTSDGPWLVENKAATRQIEYRRVKKDRQRLLAQQAGLAGPYRNLQAARAKLDVKDPAAVQAFNAQTTAYTAEVQRIRNALVALDAFEESVVLK